MEPPQKRKKDHGGKVICEACKQVMDKDYFKVHCERKHKGNKDIRYQRMVEKGQKTLPFITKDCISNTNPSESDILGRSLQVPSSSKSAHLAQSFSEKPEKGGKALASTSNTESLNNDCDAGPTTEHEVEAVMSDATCILGCTSTVTDEDQVKVKRKSRDDSDHPVQSKSSESNIRASTEREQSPSSQQTIQGKPVWIESVAKLKHAIDMAKKIVDFSINTDEVTDEPLLVDINEVALQLQVVSSEIVGITNEEISLLQNTAPEVEPSGEDEVEFRHISHDPGLRLDTLSAHERRYLISLGPCQPKLNVFPRNPNIEIRKQSKFSAQRYEAYPFLEYSVETKKAYCFVCKTFPETLIRDKSELAWINGVDNWSKMMGSRGKSKVGKLEAHFKGKSHENAMRDYISFVNGDKSIDVLLRSNHKQSIIEEEYVLNRNREVIKILLDIARTLARQGLPFRGHDEENGNFYQIVQCVSRHNSTLKSWLENQKFRKYHVLYLSGKSQNEFLHLLGDELRRLEHEEIHACDSPMGVMADTTPDVAHKDQMTVAVRYTTKDGEPKERLISTTPVLNKSGAGMANSVLSELNRANIDTRRIYFQTYDSTSSMSGVYNGAQKIFSDLLGRKIVYIACLPHGSNLVIEHGTKASILVQKVYETLELAYTFFSASTKRHNAFTEKIKNVEGALLLRNLSRTRWSARPEAVKAFWTSYEEIEELLTEISNTKDGNKSDKDTAQQAETLLMRMQSIDFVVGIMFLKNVMWKSKMMVDKLQEEELDVSGAIIAMENCKSAIVRIRQDDENQNNEIEAALSFMRNRHLDPEYEFQKLHRRRKKPGRLDTNPEAEVKFSIKDHYRKEFDQFLDTTIHVLSEKIDIIKSAFKPIFDVLTPGASVTEEKISILKETFPYAVPCIDLLSSEMELFHDYSKQKNPSSLSVRDVTMIAIEAENNYRLFSSVARIGRLLLAAPPSVCKSERSFSKLKLGKTVLQSTTSDKRLDDLMLLFCERDLSDKIDMDLVAEKWKRVRQRRISIAKR